MAHISLQDVVVSYPTFKLGPLDLEIEKGEFFGILGPPSSGKTSILKVILGLLPPDSGKVLLDGRNSSGIRVDQRNISMVFQNLALFPNMTGGQNITFPLTERRRPAAEISAQLDFVSKVLHVEHILHKFPSQMSGGERQRIALGRAFAAQTQAMLLDEPIAALDARLREEMRVELKRLQREKNQTFVYVSHDEEEVMAVSDRVGVVIDGRMAQVGTPDEIYDRPASLAVARVIGSPPMNIFAAVRDRSGKVAEAKDFPLSVNLGAAGAPGEQVNVGIRPEDIRITPDGPIAATVMTSEPLGTYTIISVSFGSQRAVKIRVQGQVNYLGGDNVRLSLDPDRLHCFAEDGRRI
jgi:ABC-type sugar transport system ATPase subunit